jgi:hypothetical protein
MQEGDLRRKEFETAAWALLLIIRGARFFIFEQGSRAASRPFSIRGLEGFVFA